MKPSLGPEKQKGADGEDLHETTPEISEQKSKPGGGPSDFNDRLPPRDDPKRPEALFELVKSELQSRWQCGGVACVEDYARRYAEISADPRLMVRLLVVEYHARVAQGKTPDLSEFRGRFPVLFAALREQLGVSDSGDSSRIAVSDEYVLEKRLGKGTFGEVFQGVAPGGIAVAVKIIHRTFDDVNGRRELLALEMLRSLNHPYLLQTHSFRPHQNRLLIVMELADGSLADWQKKVQENGPDAIPVATMVQYFSEASEALDYLHQNDVQHRDIKPDNLLMLRGHAKVADFGVARLLGHDQDMMKGATLAGTPMYIAPEIWKGRLSPHSDQYSLALTYAELRLGRPVFSGAFADVMFAHLNDTPQLDPLPVEEQKVLLRALAKKPEDRFPTCQAFADGLRQALLPPPSYSGTSYFAETGPVPTALLAPPKRRSRRVQTILAGGLALALLILIVGIVLKGRRTEDPFWLPPDARAGKDANVVSYQGNRLYDTIVLDRYDQELRFHLIVPRPDTNDPPPFYMMEFKVWNGLFKAAWKDPEMQKRLDVHRQAHPWTVTDVWQRGGEAKRENLGSDEDRWPVLRVTVTEAHCFADLIGGRLPSRTQWEKAAGRLDNLPHPYRENYRRPHLAIGRDDPRPCPVGSAEDDVSHYKCHDMGGNGREWTRTSFDTERIEEVPFANPRERDQIWIRGWDYGKREPLLFFDPENPYVTYGEYGEASSTIGFRVVIEPKK